jgi:hypothetical protein
VNVYLSIGNSDDKLTQAEWAEYVADMAGAVVCRAKQVHGTWFSLPACPGGVYTSPAFAHRLHST